MISLCYCGFYFHCDCRHAKSILSAYYSRWRHCEGTLDVGKCFIHGDKSSLPKTEHTTHLSMSYTGNECPSSSGLGVFGLHDSLHFVHRHHVFCRFWTLGHGLCGHLSRDWIFRHPGRTDRIILHYEKGEAQLLYCFLHRRSGALVGLFDDRSVFAEFSRKRAPSCWRNLW